MESMELNVINEKGQHEKIKVLSFYQLTEYDHEYIFYTKGEEADSNNVWTYISIIKDVGNSKYVLEKITNPVEESKVEELINQEVAGIMGIR